MPTCPLPEPRRGAFAIGGNYSKHVEAASKSTGIELQRRKGATLFVKPTASFIGPTDTIEYDPSFTVNVDYEVELGLVIGRGGRDIARADALDHVFGFMVVNDVSARDQMLRNKPIIDYFRGKGLDTFLPMGPGITPRSWLGDHSDLRLRLWVNGDLRQDDSTAQMVRGVEDIIAELTRSVSIRSGDVIATGTPAGVAVEMDPPAWLEAGDNVVAEIEGLGRLENPVAIRPSPIRG